MQLINHLGRLLNSLWNATKKCIVHLCHEADSEILIHWICSQFKTKWSRGDSNWTVSTFWDWSLSRLRTFLVITHIFVGYVHKVTRLNKFHLYKTQILHALMKKAQIVAFNIVKNLPSLFTEVQICFEIAVLMILEIICL